MGQKCPFFVGTFCGESMTEIKTKTITLTQEQLKDPDQVNAALLQAMEAKKKYSDNKAALGKISIKGKAIVRKKDGSISYKDPSKAGQFAEEKLNDYHNGNS